MRATCFSLCFPGVAGQRLRKLLTPMVVVEQGGRTGRRLLVCGCAGSSVLALDLTGLAVEGELWGENSPLGFWERENSSCCVGLCLDEGATLAARQAH